MSVVSVMFVYCLSIRLSFVLLLLVADFSCFVMSVCPVVFFDSLFSDLEGDHEPYLP